MRVILKRIMVLLPAQAAILATVLFGQAAQPPDFAIRFEFGLCTNDIVDTFEGTFVRDMGPHDPAVSIPLVLPSEMLNAIYGAVEEARFFEYPSEFHVSGSSAFAPAEHYRLEVRTTGVRHVVTWRDAIRPTTAEADRLRSLFSRIRQLVVNLPDVQRLPRAGVGCA
jgi:hypothetical protein